MVSSRSRIFFEPSLGRWNRQWIPFLAALSLMSAAGAANAQVGARQVREPPAASFRLSPALDPAARTLMAAGATRPGGAREIFYDLIVRHEDGALYNPATGASDKVRLRSYTGDAAESLIPFVGPRVDLRPGDTFRMTLKNRMEEADPSCGPASAPNTLRCFNSLNNHAHGLWVSPAGNSDNVLITIRPNVDFQYEYNVPEDHPAGTFWYHSHLHGSTAVQVSSGMAGPLIIRGDRVPVRRADGSLSGGDVDTLLKEPNGAAFRERTVLFQQIAYACRDAAGAIKTNSDGTWRCDAGDTGTIENADQLGPASWDASGRYTAINGELLPTFPKATANVVERWRIIHGGVRDTIRLRFRKLSSDGVTAAASLRAASAAQKQAFVDQHCTGDPLPTFGIATDGLTRPTVSERTDTFLQPGYREDLLISFPEAGAYCVIDGELEPAQVVNEQPHGRELLGYVEVGAGADEGLGPLDRVRAALLVSAAIHMPADIRNQVISDLAAGLKLTAFMKHAPVTDAEVNGRQTAGFTIAAGGFRVGNIDAGGLLVDAEPYDPAKFRVLSLGRAEEWRAKSFGGGGHPFHIHVNPFQIVSVVRESDGVDVSALSDTSQSQYATLKGVWKDTIFLQPGHMITFRTRYERYIGDFVLHCHILDHEDRGMRLNVRIAIPYSSGAPTSVGHH